MDERELAKLDELMDRMEDHVDWWGGAGTTSEWFDSLMSAAGFHDRGDYHGILHEEFQQHLAIRYRETEGQFAGVLWTNIIEMMRPAPLEFDNIKAMGTLIDAIKDEWRIFRCPLQRIATALAGGDEDPDLDPPGYWEKCGPT